ncbi:hypothetical protein V1281_002579 [Nitrobacteraceae bacterium AZCC 2161]
MGSAVFLYRDYAVTGLLTGGSWRPALPLANVQNPDIGVVARSTDASHAATKLILDLGVTKIVGGFAIGPSNMSPGAAYRVRAYSDQALSDLLYDSSVTIVPGSVIDWGDPGVWLEWENPDFWNGYINFDDTINLPLYLGIVFPADIFAQYFLVEIFDDVNPDGYVQIGRVLCTKAWRPSLNYAPDSNALGIEANTDVQTSIDGNRSYWEHAQRRTWRCSFPYLPEAEAFDSVFSMANASGVSRQVFIIPDPDDGTRARKRNFLATFKALPAIAQLNVELGSTELDFEEVL